MMTICDISRSPTSRLMSSAGAECVSRPIEMKSTPVAAIARTLSSVMPPDASTSARPATISTQLRISSTSMLSSRMMSAPPSSASRQHRRGSSLRPRCACVCGAVWRASATTSARSSMPRERDGGDVVVLDQHAGRQVEAVVLAAAAAHGVALELAQARRRLARVEDDRPSCRRRRRRTRASASRCRTGAAGSSARRARVDRIAASGPSTSARSVPAETRSPSATSVSNEISSSSAVIAAAATGRPETTPSSFATKTPRAPLVRRDERARRHVVVRAVLVERGEHERRR